jgi:predicted transcriptional regulator YdeE
LAPDIGEMKLLAAALKMGSAFNNVDKLARKWIEDSWKDLDPKELEEDEKREWYDLRDSWERANKELRSKIERFEVDPYSRGSSPILRYERFVGSMGVEGKLFLGLNSEQAKGYRIIELSYPRWFEDLMKSDSDVFRSENLSEGDVYALVPDKGMDKEKLSVLNSDFWDDLEKAGVPAFEKVGEVTQFKPEFVSRFDKVVDKRLPFDSNVLRVQALVEQIKHEHALAIPGVRTVAVGPPVSPIRAVVPITPKAPEAPHVTERLPLIEEKIIKYFSVLNAKPVSLSSFVGGAVASYSSHGAWSTLKEIRELEEERGNKFPALAEYKPDTPALWVTFDKRMALRYLETADQWDRLMSNAPLTASDLELMKEIAEVTLYSSDVAAWTDFDRGYLILRPAAAEKQKIDSDNEIQTLWQQLTEKLQLHRPLIIKRVPSAAFAVDGFYDEKTGQVLLTINEKQKSEIKDDDLAVVLIHEILHGKYPQFSERQIVEEVQKQFEAIYHRKVPQDVLNIFPEERPEGKPLIDEDEVFMDMPYRGQEPESLAHVQERLTAEGFDLANLQKILSDLKMSGQIVEPKPGFYTWAETEAEVIREGEEEKKLEIEEANEVIKENNELIKTFKKEIAKPTPIVSVEKSVKPPKPLSDDEIRLLQDLWVTEFFRSLGRVPPNITSVFRVEFDANKTKSFDEAKEAILKAADEILEEMKAREVAKRGVPLRPAAPSRMPSRVPIREETGGKEEENHGVPLGRVPPAQFPSFPLCYNLPFPRGPCSEEQIRLWNAFLYQMQQQGFDGNIYDREFREYIEDTQFLSWEDLHAKFDEFIKTLKSGQQLPPLFVWRGAPIPTGLKGEMQELEPLEQKESLIVHYSGVVIRNKRSNGEIPTLEDLKAELVDLNVIPQETELGELRDVAKVALTRALEKKDFRLSGISVTEINDFLST